MYARSYADLFGFIEERLAGMEDIVGNGGREYTLYRMAERYRHVRKAEIRHIVNG